MRQLQTSTLSNQTIAAYLLVGTYTADDTRAILVTVSLDQVAGGGDYLIYVTRQLAGAGSEYMVGPITTFTVPAATTAIGFTSVLIPVDNTDVVRVYVKGLATDTTTPDIITRFYELTYLRPVVVGAAFDTTGSGLTALGDTRIANLDATVSSRSTYAGADTAGTTTLLSRLSATRAGYLDNLSGGAVALASALTTAQTDLTTLLSRLSAARAGYLDALASNGALIAATVWAYATRTLTQSAASVAATVAGTTITVQRGDSWSIALTGLGNISTRSKLWFTIKEDTGLADTASTVQIEETLGLLYLNASSTVTAAHGTITVTNATTGALTIALDEASSVSVAPGSYAYDIQVRTAAGAVTTLSAGTCIVEADVTRATS